MWGDRARQPGRRGEPRGSRESRERVQATPRAPSPQAQLYASRPGHAAVGRVGLKGVFFRDGPSFDELLLQLRWATDSVASTFLPPADCRTTMWDIFSSFPEWVRLDKAGANAYQPVSRGMLVGAASAAEAAAAREAAAAAAAAEEEERAVQEAIELSLRS